MMHLLAATPGRAVDGAEAVDLDQSPGDIVILSAADSDLACLSAAHASQDDTAPRLRLANLMGLAHNLSVDLYVETVIGKARLIIVRMIGGIGYWPYGIEQIAATARERGISLAVVPGDDKPDPALSDHSTLPVNDVQRIHAYFTHGGVENARALLAYAASLIGRTIQWTEPALLPAAGLYMPDQDMPGLAELQAGWRPDRPVAAIVFYRALVQSGNLKPVDALIRALTERDLNALPIYVSSLKDAVSADLVVRMARDSDCAVVLNATGFAVSSPGSPHSGTPLEATDCPVLQVIFSGSNHAGWLASAAGLSARDIAMNVALPEFDGRLLSRAVSFKAEARFDPRTECPIIAYEPVADRIAFVADLAANWVRLRRSAPADRRLVLVLANYPNRDARIGNGVGLDTPASIVVVLQRLAGSGYRLDNVPGDAEALMKRLVAGPTNAPRNSGSGGVRFSLAAYRAFFETLPATVRQAIAVRWESPEADPFIHGGDFVLPVICLGNVAIAVQPARGYNIDPKATYHDPDLVPPHGYLAFHAWLRRGFDAHAVIHMGKHGNLEWLPGKAVALSESCYPEAVLGPLPNLYPFIVNDPGEGSQAKRRSAAVIIDHLTPPLTRAETYGPLKDLEALVDEYFEAATLDPRRLDPLATRILELVEQLKIDRDCGIGATDDDGVRLRKLDSWLCELKEMQIRDGLHVFGRAPKGRLLNDLLVALLRLPRGDGRGGEASLHRALAADLEFGDFDPLDCTMAAPWTGPWPAALTAILPEAPWRSTGDTVERLEVLAAALVAGRLVPDPCWIRSRAVLAWLETCLRSAVEASGDAEFKGLLDGLAGRFVEPGPSGAPSRGRPDVLPTGRNFYSLDTRAVPTPTAWHLAWRATDLLLARYRQDHGDWPRRLALSAWGTANMRTGGDDIAQALALIGARPDWEASSGRVIGFEVLPLTVLDRPRVDVTFRISGFFRDAFPWQIDLLDSALRTVAALDEPESRNPLAAAVRREAGAMQNAGMQPATAWRRAGFRIFGSKPGAYGAGLQTLIDEQIWDDDSDLANAYIGWGGYAYGDGAAGTAEHGLFEDRLRQIQAVLHNQDNTEHDILDSDDYYQFEGGLAVTVRHLSGTQPTLYHGDHSRPESPRIRTLEDQIARVVRGRVVNPKWIAGVMRHGYKGASEMTATVDYLFAFAATARCVGDHHFDAVFEAFIEDPAVAGFLERHNPAALADIAARLEEARRRGLWRPGRNSIPAQLARFSRES